MSAVTFEKASFSYDGKKQALRDISLKFEEGSFISILGGNGSGKSTLAKLINALFQPDAGTVEVFEHNTSDPHNLLFIRSNAGMVFQNPDDQIVASVVEDDVAFGPENLGISEDELIIRVKSALEQVGLAGFSKRETHTLSGGQKQRVAFAGVLALHPRILILDEAGAMLDPRGQEELFKTCRELNKEGLTVIFITHSMDEAAQTDRIIILQDGVVAEDGAPHHVLSDVAYLQRMNLDIPFAARMSGLLQEHGVCIPVCITIDELVESLQPLLLNADDSGIEAQLRSLSSTPEANRSVQAGADDDTALSQTIQPLLSLHDVSFTYVSKSVQKRLKKQRSSHKSALDDRPDSWGNDPHEMWALKDVDLDVYQGDFLGIAGHTGSGKSTLIQLANGILQPTKGRVLLKGHDLSIKKDAREAHRHVGLVFQYPERQLFAATVFDDVAFGPRNLGIAEDEVRRRVHDALELMQLDAHQIEEKSPFALSGGQQRRVAIAGILAMKPEVLILDEPTAGLDPRSHEDLLALVSDLHAQQGITVIMVSHNMDDLAYRCNRVVILNQGTIYAQGEPYEIFDQPEALTSIGLALPHTLQLMRRLCLSYPDDSLEHASRSIPTAAELAQHIAQLIHASQGCVDHG